MDVHTHIGRRLRSRRRMMNLSQSAVAEAIGVRFQQVQKYENAVNRISAEKLWQLSRVLEVPVGYFFEGLDAEHRVS